MLYSSFQYFFITACDSFCARIFYRSIVANFVCIIREKLWSDNRYLSLNINLEEESDEDEGELDIDDEEDERGSCEIDYVIGDVTHPLKAGDQDAIIVHCVGKY